MPARLTEQPDGGLLDKLVFGVSVGHGESVQVGIIASAIELRVSV